MYLNAPWCKINDGRVFLHVKRIFGKADNVQNDVGREAGDFKLSQKVILVCVVFSLRLAVEFRQQVEQVNLRNNVFVEFVLEEGRRRQLCSQVKKWRLRYLPF